MTVIEYNKEYDLRIEPFTKVIESGPFKGYTEDLNRIYLNNIEIKPGDHIYVKDSYKDDYHEAIFVKYHDGEVYAYLIEETESDYFSWRYCLLEV